jgi:hypothetical protein
MSKCPPNYSIYMECIVTRVLQTFLAPKHFILNLSDCDTCPPSWGPSTDSPWHWLDLRHRQGLQLCPRVDGQRRPRDNYWGPSSLRPPRASIADTIPVALSKFVKSEGWFVSQYLRSPKCTMVPRESSVQGLQGASPTVRFLRVSKDNENVEWMMATALDDCVRNNGWLDWLMNISLQGVTYIWALWLN